MDWMYRDSSQVVDPEEYLLGRKVDKQFEKSSLPPDKDQEALPVSIFSQSVIENQVDIARKLQEDPLYLIKKKEIESRQQLLKNPRKVKQLQEMLARQQAVADKLKRKQMKKVKKLKKSKDLDALLAKKCKTILGGFDMKKLVALESDTSSENNSNKPHKYKKKKKSEDLDKLLALKYKKLIGKVDPKKLAELSSNSESDVSSKDKNTEKNTKKALSSSESESSYDGKSKKKVRGFPGKDDKVLKSNKLTSDSKRNKYRDSSDEEVDRGNHKSNYKDKKSKYRDSSIDSQISHEDKKQKLHRKSNISVESGDYIRSNSTKSSHHERYKSKSSEQRKESDKIRSRHKRNVKSEEDSTDLCSYKSKKFHYKQNAKTIIRSNSGRRENRHDDYSSESSSSTSYSKLKIKQNDCDKNMKTIRNKRQESNSSCIESRKKNEKQHIKSGKSKTTLRKTKSASSSPSSDSDSSLSNRKSNQKKQYGLVLPANYVPKKIPDTAIKKLPSQEKTEVKPFKREEKRKLTEEEKEKRLQEMMNNAKWRDDLRDTNVKTYKKKLEAEKDSYVYSEDFMRNQMSYAMSQETVESRVKAKINTIQRTKDAMSENFARRK